MVDISGKISTLRHAMAQAVVCVSRQETIIAIKENRVAKGNVYEVARTAALLAIKRTSETIPDCHQIPIEHAAVHFSIEENEIRINVEVKAIYKTGVEVEAMHGAAVAALTIYDMLKPIDKSIEIKSIKLIEKKGGKSDFSDMMASVITAAVIVSSDSVAQKKKSDSSGKIIKEKLEKFNVAVERYVIVPDEPEQLQKVVQSLCDEKINLIVITGGTGLTPRDKTPEALKNIIEREIPGIMEAARAYGQSRTPYAMLSRGVAGMRQDTLIIAVPGSSKGAAETINAIFPAVLHIFKVQEYGFRH